MASQTDLTAWLVAIAAHAGLAGAVYVLAPYAEITKERCDNQVDDDNDGLVDCDDDECSTQPKVATACRIERCDNNIDDDGDGLVDCDDPDCSESPIDPACLPPVPIEVKIVPPEPPPPEPEPEPEPEPPPVAAVTPPSAPKPAASPKPATPPPATPPVAPPPVVFGITAEGGTDGPGMAVPEGNTLSIDPALSEKPKGPIVPLSGPVTPVTPLAGPSEGVQGGTGTKEVSAAEVTTPPKQAGCDDSVAKDFPKEAREAGVEGKVFLELLIDEAGKVTEAKIAQGLGFGLDELAIARAKTCSFTPAKKGDQAVAFRIKRFPVLLLPE